MTAEKERLFDMNPEDTLDEFVVDKFLTQGLSHYAKTYIAKSGPVIKLFVAKVTKPIYPRLLEKFQYEAETLARLSSSPHVINAVTGYRENGVHNEVEKFAPYYAMERMEGNLEDYMNDADTEIPLLTKLDIMLQVISATKDFHKIGISHRDMYTPNILYNLEEGRLICKVADFGSAKDINRQQTTPYYEPTGNDKYSSPESAVGLLGGDEVSEELMRKSDIFALGLMMYEVLTGSRQESLLASIAGIIAMSNASEMFTAKKTVEDRQFFLTNEVIPHLLLARVLDVTENDILDTEQVALKLTIIMKSMLEPDFSARENSLQNISDQITEIKTMIEARP